MLVEPEPETLEPVDAEDPNNSDVIRVFGYKHYVKYRTVPANARESTSMTSELRDSSHLTLMEQFDKLRPEADGYIYVGRTEYVSVRDDAPVDAEWANGPAAGKPKEIMGLR